MSFPLLKQEPSAQEDPAKRYYQAFPALSSESSGEKGSLQRNSIHWPRPEKQLADDAIPANAESSAELLAAKKKQKRKRSTNSTMSSQTKTCSSGRSVNNRQSSSARAKVQPTANGRSNGKKGPSECWDTNFEGAWEMGKDLIREFIMKQDKGGAGEGEAQSMMKLMEGSDAPRNQLDAAASKCISDEEELNLMKVVAACSAFIGTQVSASANTTDSGTYSSIADSNGFLAPDAHNLFASGDCITPDTFSSLNELDGHSQFSAQRRLYEREASFESINRAIDKSLNEENDLMDENKHLAAFEAKFDRNVEALWADEDEVDANANFGCAAASAAPLNDQSFWSNYCKHQYNNAEEVNTAPPRALLPFPDQRPAQLSLPFMTNANELSSARDGPMSMKNLFENSAAPISGVNLTASIWSDVSNNNQDDVSFYGNGKQWENDHKIDGQLNVSTKLRPKSGKIDFEFFCSIFADEQDGG